MDVFVHLTLFAEEIIFKRYLLPPKDAAPLPARPDALLLLAPYSLSNFIFGFLPPVPLFVASAQAGPRCEAFKNTPLDSKEKQDGFFLR